MLKSPCYWMLIAFFSVPASAAEVIRLTATQDNSIILVDGEWDHNAGQQGRIRIKGNQHIVAMAFDTMPLIGRRVKKATLVCAQDEQQISGLSVSTIASPWDENRSSGLSSGINGMQDWGYPGAKFPAVCGGNSFTLVQQTMSEMHDGRYHWDVAPDLIYAMTIGAAYGLALHEHDADYGRNPTIFSREQSGRQPYLMVETDDVAEPQPEAATNLKLTPIDSSSARLTVTSPASGFAYEVIIDGQPLGRHNIPLVRVGEQQQIPVRDLPKSVDPKRTHEIQVVTISRTGQRSSPAVLRNIIFTAVEVPRPTVKFQSSQPVSFPGLSVIPVTDKFDASGSPVGNLPDSYRTQNPIFNGQRVHLTAAAGEVAGFQLLLRKSSERQVSIKVELDPPQTRINLQQAIYVPANGRMIPDPLLPLPDSILLTDDRDEVVVADLFIPFNASPGLLRGRITVSDGRVIPLEVEVLNFALPRKATFFCEMNGYGLPDDVRDYYALQQIAYDHRVHANILHYSHHTAAPGARKSSMDMRLTSGRRMDNLRYDDLQPGDTRAWWDDFAEAFGPFLDGSLFRDGHRGSIPAPGFYLTFHESWPLNCRAFFNGNPDAFEAFREHPEYAQTYISILQDFARLAETRKWIYTGFQIYFNNKGSLTEETKAPWILDEPASFWDYRALKFYGELTDSGRRTTPGVPVHYRIDISRPEFCRGQLDRKDDLWIVSSWAFENYRRLVTDRIERDGLRAWVYGTSNHVHESNRNIQAWALDSWQYGATGLVPWQTIDKSGAALKEADQLGLFIFDKTATGETAIRHSLRLKAYRDVQQLIEYLNLLRQKKNWSQDQIRQFVTQYVDLTGQVNKTSEEDAGTSAYGMVSGFRLEELRLAAAKLLQAP